MMSREKRSRHKALRRAMLSLGAASLVLFTAVTIRLYQKKIDAQAQADSWRSRWEGTDSLGEKTQEFGQGKNTIVYKGKTYERRTYMKAYLFMGVDRSDSLEEATVPGKGGQADGIFLAAWDTSRNQIKILMIPRDTMTEIPLTDLSGNELGQDIQHLTLAYAYGDGREKSCDYMVRAVTNLCGGLEIDRYMAVSMGALPVVNDLVGGVEVTIEDEALEGQDEAFALGETVTLKGKQAERFLRYRNIQESQTALGRMGRHQAYLEGFSKAAKEQAGKEEGLAVKILEGIMPYLVTDMSKDEYLKITADFLNSGQTLTEEDFLIFPGRGEETGLYDEYDPDMEGIQEMVLSLFYRLKE